MNEQLNWWPFGPWLNLAPSRLSQPILPDWSMQHVDVNFAGNPAIEKDVVGKVASYGKQLGILTDAVLALADGSVSEREACLARLRAVAERIAEIKTEHKGDLAEAARAALDSLARADPAAARRLAAQYATRGQH